MIRPFWGEYVICARELIPACMGSKIVEAHNPSVTEDGSTDEKVYIGLTEDYELRKQGDPEDLFMKNVKTPVKMTRTRNASIRVQQVKTDPYAFLHVIDWAGKLRLEENWTREVGRAMS